jgi:hypothetical protein
MSTNKRKPKQHVEPLEILAEELDKEFQRALKESTEQIRRGELSSVAALKAIYGRR